MIVDTLERANRYFSVHPRFKEAFTFIRQFNEAGFVSEKVPLDGQNLIAIMEAKGGRGRAEAPLEAHRRYIDIQFTLQGNEEIGWKPYCECKTVSRIYDEEKDIEKFSDAPALWVLVPPTSFAIFFPEDAHAPLAGSSDTRKIIMKVLL